MNSDFSTGLMVSIVGLAVTFIALLVFIGVIYLLKAIFPYKAAQSDCEAEDSSAAEEGVDICTEEKVAAILAVTYARKFPSGKPDAGKNPIWTLR